MDSATLPVFFTEENGPRIGPRRISKMNNNNIEQLSSLPVRVTTIIIKDVDLDTAQAVVEAICIATNPNYLPLVEVEYDAEAKVLTLIRVPTWIEVFARLAAELYDAPLLMWFQRLNVIDVVDNGDIDKDVPYDHLEAMYHHYNFGSGNAREYHRDIAKKLAPALYSSGNEERKRPAQGYADQASTKHRLSQLRRKLRGEGLLSQRKCRLGLRQIVMQHGSDGAKKIISGQVDLTKDGSGSA
jgi:hypothetical protein